MKLISVCVFLSLMLGYVVGGKVMVWMCLERCGDTEKDILSQLNQLNQKKSTVSIVSFEKYNLGANSQLVDNDLYEVNPALMSMGFTRYAMVSSYPYPPEFIDYMRQLFANPTPFIQQCISEARRLKLHGYNIDFEPATGVVASDAAEYVKFLTTFTKAMHTAGIDVTVDIAQWSTLWSNWTAIAESGVDQVYTMSTYTGNFSTFKAQLMRGITEIGTKQLAVGMQTINPNTNADYSTEEVKERFDALRASGAKAIGMWKTPIPEIWVPFVDDFAKN